MPPTPPLNSHLQSSGGWTWRCNTPPAAALPPWTPLAPSRPLAPSPPLPPFLPTGTRSCRWHQRTPLPSAPLLPFKGGARMLPLPPFVPTNEPPLIAKACACRRRPGGHGASSGARRGSRVGKRGKGVGHSGLRDGAAGWCVSTVGAGVQVERRHRSVRCDGQPLRLGRTVAPRPAPSRLTLSGSVAALPAAPSSGISP